MLAVEGESVELPVELPDALFFFKGSILDAIEEESEELAFENKLTEAESGEEGEEEWDRFLVTAGLVAL